MRLPFLTLAVPVLALSSSAQEPALLPAGAVEHAGTFVLASGALVPTPEGPGDVVYRNDCPSGTWFASCGTRAFLDDGRLPSLTSAPLAGDAASYRIDRFEIGYVTSAADPTLAGPGAHVRLEFWERYHPCALPWTQPAPSAVLDLAGLPGSLVPGSPRFVTVVVDLAGSGQEFCLRADGDGVYDGEPNLDSFAWTIAVLDEPDDHAGVLIAGDAGLCAEGDGTRWQALGQSGTGLGNSADWRHLVTSGATACGVYGTCFSFAPQPWRGFHLVLESSSPAGCVDPGTPFCHGDDCFCGNVSTSGGCANSTGTGALLGGLGSPSLAEDDLVLTVSDLPPQAFALLFGGATTISQPFGAGRSCVFGVRYLPVVTSDSAGSLSLGPGLVGQQAALAGAFQPGDTWHYQVYYRDVRFCLWWNQDVNMSNAYTIHWIP